MDRRRLSNRAYSRDVASTWTIVSSCGLIGRSRLTPDGSLLQEPARVAALDLAVLGELAEGVLDERRELRVALAEHEAVGIVGEEVADDGVLALRPFCASRP